VLHTGVADQAHHAVLGGPRPRLVADAPDAAVRRGVAHIGGDPQHLGAGRRLLDQFRAVAGAVAGDDDGLAVGPVRHEETFSKGEVRDR
jgi:hypothetical protein